MNDEFSGLDSALHDLLQKELPKSCVESKPVVLSSLEQVPWDQLPRMLAKGSLHSEVERSLSYVILLMLYAKSQKAKSTEMIAEMIHVVCELADVKSIFEESVEDEFGELPLELRGLFDIKTERGAKHVRRLLKNNLDKKKK